jgi:hypothetical protein
MHFSDDELREALRRKDPGEAFTQKVMARVAQKQSQAATSSSEGNRFQEFCRRMGLRPVLVGAIVALLAFSGLLGVVKYRREREAHAGEAAKRQALLALRITSAKLNHVFERAENPQAPVSKERNP